MSEKFRQIRTTLDETGLRGVARRGVVRAADALGKRFHDLATVVRFEEFRARIRPVRDILAPNSDLKGLHSGERVFVLGNGPSLATQDIEWLKDEVTMVCNAFFKHRLSHIISPTYYFVTDGLLFQNIDEGADFWEGVLGVPGSTVFVPADYRDAVGPLLRPRDRFVALNGYLPNQPLWSVDLTTVLPSPPTVVQTAIMAALYMGASEIVLLGCDHNWLDDFGTDEHFYDGPTANHTPDLEELEMRTQYKQMLEFVLNLLIGYERIRDFAASGECQILNATAGGRLQLFPRVEFETFKK